MNILSMNERHKDVRGKSRVRSATSGKLIDLYVLRAIIPYVLLALFLLTAILLAQQVNRFTELLLVTQLPSGLTSQLLLSLLPTAVTFATPTAILAGVLIGMSRMGGDSEVIAMRAAGVGAWNIMRAPLGIGIGGALAMFYVGMYAGPEATETLRKVGLQIALYKLDSPVEPKAFNTDLPGKTIYVREGDRSHGQWGKVFIYSEEKNTTLGLITARAGRIDSAAEQSELVLTDAVRTQLPLPQAAEKGAEKNTDHRLSSVVTERLALSRVRLPTARSALLQRLRQHELVPEEMSGGRLWAHAKGVEDERQRREATILIHRRLSLAVAPIVFALLGVSLGLRIRRGGRATGIIAALLILVIYYLLSLAGEQLARAERLGVAQGLWLATFVTLSCAVLLLWRGGGAAPLALKQRAARAALWRAHSGSAGGESRKAAATPQGGQKPLLAQAPRAVNLISLLDRNLLGSLTANFSLSFLALVTIFMVFTVFELSKFVAASGQGARLIGRYLFYLLPLAAVSLTQTAVLVAVLATYAMLARRSEALAWWASGQSVYRLAMPAIFFAGALGSGVWFVQERVMPKANQKQDALRAQIRSGVTRSAAPLGRQWLASADGRRIYAYDYEERGQKLLQPMVFEFDQEGIHLRRIVSGAEASWGTAEKREMRVEGARALDSLTGEWSQPGGGGALTIDRVEDQAAFKPTLSKPSQLSKSELSNYIKRLKAHGAATSELAVALARKEAEPFNPLVMALVGIPFAISFGRKSAIAALAMALAIGVGFWGISSGVQQLGVYGLLPPQVSVWAPVVIFTTVGIYFLSKTKT